MRAPAMITLVTLVTLASAVSIPGAAVAASPVAIDAVCPAERPPPARTEVAVAAEDMAAASVDLDAAASMVARDPEGAIVRYEAGLRKLPQGTGYAPARARGILALVDAHAAANARDAGDDLEALCRGRARLLRAQGILDRYLGPLELLDEEGRAAAEERRVEVLAAIAASDGRILREKAARDAAAARRRARLLTASGAALIGGGAVGLALMGVGVTTGRAADQQLPKEPCAVDDPICRDDVDFLRFRGERSNMLVLGGAVVGGALLVGGAALLLLGRGDRRRADAIEAEARRLWVDIDGAGLTLRGRF